MPTPPLAWAGRKSRQPRGRASPRRRAAPAPDVTEFRHDGADLRPGGQQADAAWSPAPAAAAPASSPASPGGSGCTSRSPRSAPTSPTRGDSASRAGSWTTTTTCLSSVDVVVEDGRPEAWDLTDELAQDPKALGPLVDWLELQFAENERIVVKDPRLAWFLELHRAAAAKVGADIHVATMLRHPAEVMRSREIAYGTRTTTPHAWSAG